MLGSWSRFGLVSVLTRQVAGRDRRQKAGFFLREPQIHVDTGVDIGKMQAVRF